MSDENTNADDDFFAELNAGSATETDPFASTEGASASDDPFGSLEGFSNENDPFGDAEASVAQEPIEAPVEVGGKKGKKSKKEKAPKAPKAKKEKVTKTKTVKEPKPKKEKAAKRPYAASPAPIFFLGGILAALLVAANAVAFMTAGSASSTYLIVLDVLGLIILAVPALLLKLLRQRPVGIFDVFLALAAIISVVSVLFIVTGQAKYFGSASSKVSAASTVLSSEAPETRFC